MSRVSESYEVMRLQGHDHTVWCDKSPPRLVLRPPCVHLRYEREGALPHVSVRENRGQKL
jgi:hypothetical protein